MATQITATLPTLDFPLEVDYPTQEDWPAFSAAAELNFGILGGSWSTQMQNWKDQANAMSIELNNNADLAQSIAGYQGDWTSKGYTLGQSVSVSGVYYICKLTHATGQNPTSGGSLYWNLALGNWNLKVNNYGNETIAGIKTFTSSPIVPTPTTGDRSTKVATTAMFSNEFTNSLSGNGYQKLPSGLIIQWGYAGVNSGSETTVTLPISYPNGLFQIFATRNVLGTSTASIDVHASSVSQSQIKLGYFNTGGSSANIMWMTIGY